MLFDTFLTHFEAQKSLKGGSGSQRGAFQIPHTTLERFLRNYGSLGVPQGDPKMPNKHEHVEKVSLWTPFWTGIDRHTKFHRFWDHL